MAKMSALHAGRFEDRGLTGHVPALTVLQHKPTPGMEQGCALPWRSPSYAHEELRLRVAMVGGDQE